MPTKSRMLLPERFAIRMVDEQRWILRNDIAWHKPNHMPQSVKDRLANAWEHVYFFTKAKRYYFDLDAIREPHKYPLETIERNLALDKAKGIKRFDAQSAKRSKTINYSNPSALGSPRARNKIVAVSAIARDTEGKKFGFTYAQKTLNPMGKNPGDVWNITTRPTKEAHFATFPPELPNRCIKAGCPQDGVVLDPFAGSGTTLLQAKLQGKSAVGIELSGDYCKILKKCLGWGNGFGNIEWREL